MPDNNIKLGAEIELKAKNVEQELNRIGKLAQQAISFEPQNKELQEMVNLANEVYNSVNKTAEAMKLEEQLTKAIADRSSAQNFADKYASEKEKLLNLIDVRNAKGQDVSNQRAQLASLEQNLQAAQQLRDEYNQTVTTLQSKLSALQQSGADIDKSLTFENARVSASGLLELLKQIDARSTGIIAVANSVSQVESVKDIPISTAGEDSGSQLEYFKDIARQLNAELPQLRANINELASEFFRMGETTSADSMAESFYIVGTSADELLEKYNSLVDSIEHLRETAKGSLSEEEFRQFDEVVKNLGKNLMLAGQNLDYLVAIDPEMDSGSIDEQVEAYQTYIGTLESVKEAYASADLTDEQRKLFDVGAGAQINEQIDIAKQHIIDLMHQKEAINNTPPIDIKMPEDTNPKLEQTAHGLSLMIQRMNELRQEINAFNQGKLQLSDEDYVRKSAEMEMLKGDIEEYKNALSGVREHANEASVSTSKVGESAQKSSKTGVIAFSSLSKSIRTAFKDITKLLSSVGGKLTNSFNKVQKSVEKAFSGRSFKRGLTTILKYGFGVRSLYFAFRRLRTAIKEGLQNLVQYEKAMGTSQNLDSTNKAITNLNTSLLYLKNAWGAAIAPVINYVMPILTALIDKFAQVGNAIARFVGALTGQSVVLNAVKVDAQDYADSLDNTKDSANGASGAAKKLSDRLAAFDDLNVLGKDNDTSGSGGGGADFEDYMPDPSEMFTYVDATSELADTVKKYIDKIKESWETGDFTWLGETLKNKIIEGLDWLNGQWGEIQGYADKIGHSVGSVLVGLFGDPELWEKAGHNIGEAINTISIGISAFLDELDKIPFGENAGKGVNELLQTTDWELAGDNINRAITGVLDNITEFVNTLNATDIVDAITKFVTGLDIPEIVADVEKLAISVADLVITVVGGLTWQAGQSFGDFLIDWVTKDSTTAYKTDDGIEVPIEIDMTPTTDYSTNPLGALIERMVTGIGANWTNGVVNILVGFGISDDKGDALNDILTLLDNTKETLSDWGDEIEKTFEPVKQFFDDIGQFFKDTGDAIGTTLEVIGLGFEGLGEIFALGAEDIGGGIVTFMVDFVDAFEDFGDKWDEFWTNMEGFDIEDLLDGVGDFVAEEIIAPFVDFFDTFSGYGKDIIDGLSSGISEAFGTAKDWVNTHIVDPIVTGFCELFGIHSPSTVAEEWGTNLIEGLKQGIDNLIGTVMEPFNQLQTDLLDKWNTIKGDAYEKWVGMKISITEKANEIKSDAEEKFETLKTNLVNKWQEIKGAIYEKLVGIKLNMVEVFEQMKEAVKAPINGFLGIIETMVNRVIDGVNSVADTFNALPDVTLTNPFTGTDYTLGFSIPHLSSVSIPRLAEGAVIPPNREFMAVLGDQSNGTNIEAPLDTIKQAVAEVLANNGNAEMIQLLQQLITVVENKNLVIGDKDIGRANARYVKQQNIVRGSTF